MQVEVQNVLIRRAPKSGLIDAKLKRSITLKEDVAPDVDLKPAHSEVELTQLDLRTNESLLNINVNEDSD